jgi:hypothetical protein
MNTPEVISVSRVGGEAPHNAFTDLIRFRERWYCSFREDIGHVGGDGKSRILVSDDGETWESAGLLEEPGIDLRDPKMSITPDGRLMVVQGGSDYQDGKLVGMQPRVAFSTTGTDWTAPEKVFQAGEWIWRVTWHAGIGYGISYTVPAFAPREKLACLVKTTNGVDYEIVTEFELEKGPNEGSLQFAGDEMIALLRCRGLAVIGSSMPPYTDWTWREVMPLGGPQFVILPDGAMLAGGRLYQKPDNKTYLFAMTRDSLEPVLELPSSGDSSYPGMVLHDGVLWVSYYSSHEEKTAVYLAKVKV